jgi:hypothetical protein
MAKAPKLPSRFKRAEGETASCVGCGREATMPTREYADCGTWFMPPPGWFVGAEMDAYEDYARLEFICGPECLKKLQEADARRAKRHRRA